MSFKLHLLFLCPCLRIVKLIFIELMADYSSATPIKKNLPAIIYKLVQRKELNRVGKRTSLQSLSGAIRR